MKVQLRKILSLALTVSLLFQQIGFAQIATELNLANHFARMASSLTVEKFRPAHLRYFSYDALNDNFKVLLDKGDLKNIGDKELQNSTQALLSYFLVGVTLPDSMFWVNLRPDSENQIIDQYLEKTDVGKIMLSADLQLKKDTAAMTSPATPEGKEYWDRLYKKAAELYGHDNVSIPTLTRPWIVPGEIIVRESQDSAYVYKANLKVMLEQDYLKTSSNYNFKDSRSKALNEYSSELIRELIIPKLTKEVNSSKRYAPLRQVYYSLILARWFKLRFSGKTGTYASLINTKDLTNLISKESWSKSDYFKQYQKSFADGEYNIKEPVYTPTGQVIRSYFSGGIVVDTIKLDSFINKAMPGKLLDDGFLMKGDSNGIKVTASPLKNPDNKRILNPDLAQVAFIIALNIGLGQTYGPGEKRIREESNKFILPLVKSFREKINRDPTDDEAKEFYDSITTGLSQDAGRTVNNGKKYINAEAETFATKVLEQENPSKLAAGSLEQESNSSSVSSLENQAYLLALTLGIKDSERKYAAKVIMVPLIKAFIDNSNPTPTSSQAKEFYQRIINNTDRTVSVEVLAQSFAFLSNPSASLPEKEKFNSSPINTEEVRLVREREKIKEKVSADLNARFDQRFKDNDPTAVDEIVEYNARLSIDERQALYEWLQFHESKLTADAIAKIGFNWPGIVSKLVAKSQGLVKGNPRSAARQLHELAKDGTYAGVKPPVDLADKIITEAKLSWQAHLELEKLLEYKQSPKFPKLQAKRAGILVLIRHGETVRSEAVLNKWAGWADAPITENGKQEAFVAGGRLKGALRFDKAYSSDLSRAKDTLTQILRATEQSDVPVFVREEIRERDYGDMIGWRRSSVQEIFGEGVYKGWRRGYSGNAERPAGGENLKDVLERSLSVFLGEIMQDIAEGKNVIVSAHGNSLRSMLIGLRGHTNGQPLTEDEIRKLEVGLSTPIVITFDGELRHKELLVDAQKNPADVSAFLESQGVPSETSAEKGATSSTVTLSGEDKVKIQAALEKYNIYYMDSRLESEFSQRRGKGESSDSIVDFIDFISKIYGNRQSLVNALKILLSCQGSLRDIQSLINNEKYLRPSEILNLLSFYGRLLPLDIIRETVASEKESRPPKGSEAELKLPRLYDLVFNRLQEKSKSTSSALVTPLQKAEEIAGILLESDNLPPEKLSKAILITEIVSVVEKFRKDSNRDPTPFEVSQVIYQTRSTTTIQAKSVKSISSAVQNIEEFIRRNDKTELRSLLEDATVTSGTLMPVPETSGILGPGSINLDNSNTYYNGEAEFDPLFDKMVEVARKLNRPDILVLVIQRLREISAELEKKEMRERKNLIPNVYSSEAGLTARTKDTVLDRIAQLEENEAQASSAVRMSKGYGKISAKSNEEENLLYYGITKGEVKALKKILIDKLDKLINDTQEKIITKIDDYEIEQVTKEDYKYRIRFINGALLEIKLQDNSSVVYIHSNGFASTEGQATKIRGKLIRFVRHLIGESVLELKGSDSTGEQAQATTKEGLEGASSAVTREKKESVNLLGGSTQKRVLRVYEEKKGDLIATALATGLTLDIVAEYVKDAKRKPASSAVLNINVEEWFNKSRAANFSNDDKIIAKKVIVSYLRGIVKGESNLEQQSIYLDTYLKLLKEIAPDKYTTENEYNAGIEYSPMYSYLVRPLTFYIGRTFQYKKQLSKVELAELGGAVDVLEASIKNRGVTSSLDVKQFIFDKSPKPAKSEEWSYGLTNIRIKGNLIEIRDHQKLIFWLNWDPQVGRGRFSWLKRGRLGSYVTTKDLIGGNVPGIQLGNGKLEIRITSPEMLKALSADFDKDIVGGRSLPLEILSKGLSLELVTEFSSAASSAVTEEKIKEKFHQAKLPLNEYYMGYIAVSLSSIFKDGDDIDRDTAADILISVYDNNKGTGETRALNQVIMTLNNAVELKKIVKYIRDQKDKSVSSSAVQQAIIKLSDFDYIKAGKIGPDALKNRFIKKIEELIADVRKGKRREFAGELIRVAVVHENKYTIHFTTDTWVDISPQGREIRIDFRCRTGIAQSIVEAVRGLIETSQSELLEGTVGSAVQVQETGASSAGVKDMIENQETLVSGLKDEIKKLEVELLENLRRRYDVTDVVSGAKGNLRYSKPGATIHNSDRFRKETLRRDIALEEQERIDKSNIQLREKIEAAYIKLSRAEKELGRLREREGVAVSSPAQSKAPEATGGIDFRALPMTIQPMGSFAGLNFKLPQLSQAQLKQINIDSEMQQVKNLVESGIVPSGDRIKELIAACSQKGKINYYVDNLLLCLVDICKLEEQNAFETSPELREALAIVDSLGGQV